MLTQNYTNFFLLLLSFSLLFLTGCKEEENMRVRSSIEKAIEIGETQPNEARLILDSIQTEKLSKESLMLYQIADVQALYYANEPLNRELADKAAKSAQYFEAKRNTKYAALANFYTGVAYYHIDELEKGFTYYLKSYPYAKAINDSLLMGKSLYNQALMYQYQKVYDSTMVCLERAVLIFKGKPERLFRTYETMAFNYYIIGDQHKALESIEKCSSLLQEPYNYNSTEFSAYLYHNTYGLIWMKLGEYQKAIAQLSVNEANKNILPPKEQLRTYFNILNVYTLAEKTDSANYYVQQAMPLLANLEKKQPKDINDNYLMLWGYNVLRNYYSKVDDQEQYATYRDLFVKQSREVDRMNLSRRFLEINKLVDIQKIVKENKIYQTRVLVNIIVLCILFFMLTFFVIYKYAGKKNKVSTNLLLTKINNHRKELDRMKNDECRILK